MNKDENESSEFESEHSFTELGLDPRLVSALEAAGYERPTKIQQCAIPAALSGSDLLATAQTGTGKTAAFALPLLQQLLKEEGRESEKRSSRSGNGDRRGSERSGNRSRRAPVRALILSPTRELALQICDSLRVYGKDLHLRSYAFVGGQPIRKQVAALRRGVDIMVATPGRALDLLDRRAVRLNQVEFLVLDEADRMLDMGFVHDVRDIVRGLSSKRQSLLFSATISDQVSQLARVLLRNPKKISVHAPTSVAGNISERVFYVDKGNKRDLVATLLEDGSIERVLVFTATKSSASVLASVLSRKGFPAEAIHSDKNQRDRERALRSFDQGKIRVLVATDVMARGIDVDGISHVINFELPSDPESYIHRIGRTARAGASGEALSFCDMDEISMLNRIERLTESSMELTEDHPYHSPLVATLRNTRPQMNFGRTRGRGGRPFGQRRKVS